MDSISQTIQLASEALTKEVGIAGPGRAGWKAGDGGQHALSSAGVTAEGPAPPMGHAATPLNFRFLQVYTEKSVFRVKHLT
jgi:hypothetical protein